uniref:Serpin peptidase inhibitor, clade G (C1 inhibitor), member 1 n=1 Tax=Lates calcarifer TaxID=8187 RepID=A0A4W6BR61_LATCA
MKLQAVLCILLQLIFELSSCTYLRVTPGSTLELPCLSFQSDFTAATITWQFNGKDISEHPYGSVTVKKDGLYLSISPVTAANEGNYVCVMKDDQVEMIRMYNITVDGEIHTSLHHFDLGLTLKLVCVFQVVANALWFRETDDGGRVMLNLQDEENNKLELLYPLDHDQTLILRDTAMDDAGIYTCESTDGKKLSTIYIIVEVPPTETPHTCEGFTTPWEPCQDQNSRTGEPMLQESMAEFSMKLYSYLRQSDPSGNLLFSPISISGALSHLLLGARDNTRKAIERAVCVPHEFHCVHFQMKRLRERMASSLQMASQIFYNPQMNLSESFTNQSIQFYDVEPTRLLENSEENTRMINSWVANKTKNKITQLVDSVSPSTQLILLNAVSFSGQWKVKFDEKQKKGHFTKLNGDMVKVPILFHHNYMAAMMFVVELKAQVARFALSGDSSLYILLPRSSKAADLQHVEEKMTDTAVRQMIEQMKTTPPQQIEVTLPQIKLDVQPDMNILIKKLGLSSLFENPNLCGLYSEDKLVLDDARHRAFFALTKQGVEAGANVPLFIGRVTDP